MRNELHEDDDGDDRCGEAGEDHDRKHLLPRRGELGLVPRDVGARAGRANRRAIARRGRGTPRIVNRLLKRVRDHAQVHGDGHVDEATATAAMRAMEIDDEGLDSTDRKLLAAIVQKFASGPVGVAALAAVLSEEIETIEDVYEPFLLRLGFIDRTPQGRIATELARTHMAGLGYEIPPPRRPDPMLVGLWDEPTPDAE